MQKGHQKLHTLARLSTYIDPSKLEVLINTFISSQLNHCPLVLIFHNRVLKSKLILIQERALRLVCKGSETEYEKLIQKTLTAHQHNLQLLMIELYKTKHSLNPKFTRNIFTERHNRYNLKNENHLRMPIAKTTTYRLESIGCLLPSTAKGNQRFQISI